MKTTDAIGRGPGSPRRVLLVEDSVAGQLLVKAALPAPAFEIVCAGTVAEARDSFEGDSGFDLILLDLNLPDGAGLDLLGQWRSGRRRTQVPVLLLTGEDNVETKLKAFTLDAEDYMVKPVSPLELRARVDRRLRPRADAAPAAGEILQKGALKLDFTLLQASVRTEEGEWPRDLTAKEFRLVAILARNEGRTFTRRELVEKVWGPGTHVVARTVDSHICGARRKLGPAGRYIRSVSGAGYRFEVAE